MYCNKCGTELNENEIFCHNCGAKVENEVSTPQEVKRDDKANNFALAGFVLGIISAFFALLSCFLNYAIIFATIAIICSIVGLILTCKVIKRLKNGFTISALILNILGVSLGAIIFIIILCQIGSIAY